MVSLPKSVVLIAARAWLFPGTDGRLSTKEILTRLYKAVGAPLTPIL